MRWLWLAIGWVVSVSACGGEIAATGIKVEHRNGQSFVTWIDAAEGEDGAALRYSVYRSGKPITQENLPLAELCMSGVLNNSAKLFGAAFNRKDRLDPAKPTAPTVEGGQPLPVGSGLAAVTVRKQARSYYAVVATDDKGAPVSTVVPGKSATTEPVEERVAPIQPIKLEDSKSRKGPYIQQTCISGQRGLPLWVELHASSGQGGGAGEYGDYYLYFSRPEWGWRDGLPGVFSVDERRHPSGNMLYLRSREAIEHPSGNSAMETYWFGYLCVPQWAGHKEPRAYPFTERRTLWMIDWVAKRYEADPNRVYAGGGSMGAWGSATLAFRHPEIFAAVYPNRPRTRQRGMPSLAKLPRDQKALMDDGKTEYLARMDMVAFASEHHGDLPFFGWCCGRRDGFATWQEQVDMAKALTAAHHGFAFAWNDGDHSSGSAAMGQVMKHYPAHKFARNQSYPAFGNSSINSDPGPGDPKAGDMEGGINLGFAWRDVADEEGRWSATLSNELCQAEMTVDVTPRRCQRFKAKAREKLKWTNSAGGSGEIAADPWGLVTVEKVRIKPGEETVLTISR